jgi:hypothetical protein
MILFENNNSELALILKEGYNNTEQNTGFTKFFNELAISNDACICCAETERLKTTYFTLLYEGYKPTRLMDCLVGQDFSFQEKIFGFTIQDKIVE